MEYFCYRSGQIGSFYGLEVPLNQLHQLLIPKRCVLAKVFGLHFLRAVCSVSGLEWIQKLSKADHLISALIILLRGTGSTPSTVLSEMASEVLSTLASSRVDDAFIVFQLIELAGKIPPSALAALVPAIAQSAAVVKLPKNTVVGLRKTRLLCEFLVALLRHGGPPEQRWAYWALSRLHPPCTRPLAPGKLQHFSEHSVKGHTSSQYTKTLAKHVRECTTFMFAFNLKEDFGELGKKLAAVIRVEPQALPEKCREGDFLLRCADAARKRRKGRSTLR